MDLLEMMFFLKQLEEKVSEIKVLEKREGMNIYNGDSQSEIVLKVLEDKIMSYKADETH